MAKKTNATRRAQKSATRKSPQLERQCIREHTPDAAPAAETPLADKAEPSLPRQQEAALPQKTQPKPQEVSQTPPQASRRTGPASTFLFFSLAFLMLALLESERLGKFLDTFAPDPAAEKAASLIREAADATCLAELTRRENFLVERFIDRQILGAREEAPDKTLAGQPPAVPNFHRPIPESLPERPLAPPASPAEPPVPAEPQQSATLPTPRDESQQTAIPPAPGPEKAAGQASAEQPQAGKKRLAAPEIVEKPAATDTQPSGSPKAPPTAGRTAMQQPPDQPGRETRKLVLLAGDSLMAEGFGSVLHRAISRYPGVDVKREAKYSTGLSRKDFFDWPKRMGELVDELNPDLVILCLGANDAQDIVDAGKKRYGVGTPAWEDIYQQRAQGLLAEAQKKGAKVVWIGLPIMGKEPLNSRIRMLTLRQKAACESSASAVYIDTYDILKGKDGNYAAFIEDAGKKQVRIRYKDHVHVTREGGDMITQLAMPTILHELGLPAEALKTAAPQAPSPKGPQAQAAQRPLPSKK